MIGYDLIHSPALWEFILVAVVLPIGLCVVLLILLEYYDSTWYLDMVESRPTPKPGYSYGRANTNWGLKTDPYYDKEIEVNGVPVLYYKRVGGGWKAMITNTIDCPDKVDWHSSKFTWMWITELRRSGWKQDNPPSDPTIIASTGMWEHIDRILSEEQGVKTGGVNALKAHEQASFKTK